MEMREQSYVICIENSGYPAALELRKIYVRLADSEAEGDGFWRVIDESGEDYLFPSRFFAPIQVPKSAEQVFAASAVTGREDG
jgi:hypothetical protein